MQSDAAVVSSMLSGRFVQILDRSSIDQSEKQAITDLVTSLGGAITFRIKESRGSDLCLAGSAPAMQYVAALHSHAAKYGSEYDVLHASWLQLCKDRGTLLDASPADYVLLSDKTLSNLMQRDGCDQCAPLVWEACVCSVERLWQRLLLTLFIGDIWTAAAAVLQPVCGAMWVLRSVC